MHRKWFYLITKNTLFLSFIFFLNYFLSIHLSLFRSFSSLAFCFSFVLFMFSFICCFIISVLFCSCYSVFYCEFSLQNECSVLESCLLPFCFFYLCLNPRYRVACALMLQYCFSSRTKNKRGREDSKQGFMNYDRFES